ncbi:MAG: NADH-quinone oxidoreductase subunit N [Planctomycetes bacterium]|nr:NADH-quinone oxidoreductase subunit N [Planctomycetota bacterium]MCG2683791.1 NADH-quinone oxidoreductase subunit N [Planctomycetales bacterium]
MNFDQLLQNVVGDTIGPGGSLCAFRPELALCATIVAVLLAKIILPGWKSSAYYITLLGLLAACFFAFPWSWQQGGIPAAKSIFTGALIADSFTVVVRGMLLGFAVLFATFTQMTGVWDREDQAEFYVLMLGSLVGMCLMISANHILIVMLGVEMAGVPCYVLAGMKRNQPKSSEAALKYAVFGAGAAGVMLFGLSLLAGVLGSVQLPTMTARLIQIIHNGASADQTLVLALGGLMLMVGVAFKLSAVPFHFWAPDVFEGATAEVAAFISVASKAAALGLLVRLVAVFSMPSALTFPEGISLPPDRLAAVADLGVVRQYIVALLSLLAAVTCTFGNLAAYGQTNMKRLLAYSTIAHAGYMMMPVAAAAALVGSDAVGAREAIAALLIYLGIYLFMNLAAFAIVAFLRNATGSEEIADYAGLVRRSPGLTVCMAIVMFSLVGLPPLAGFWAKMTVFLALIDAKLWALLFIGALNTLLSLFYYLRVVKVMALSPEPLHREAPTIPLTSLVGSYCALLTVPVVALFFLLGGVLYWARAAAHTLFN